MAIDAIAQMRLTFRGEAMDLLIELDSALLALEETPGDIALVHRVFRAIHTIKGSGAMAGHTRMAKFAHKVEEAFDLAREGRLIVTPELIDCALKGCDVIRLILEDATEGMEVRGEKEVIEALSRLVPSTEPVIFARDEDAFVEVPASASAPLGAFEIVVKPRRELFYSGTDPMTLLDDLRELGQAHITAHTNEVPILASLEAEHCYLWWEILLVTERDQQAIQDVFVFVEDECSVTIRPLEDQAAAIALLGSVPTEMFEQFVAECEEHLQEAERGTLALERDPASRAALDSVFRSIHSIKGNAALLSEYIPDPVARGAHPLQLLVRVTHGLESLLDSARTDSVGGSAAGASEEIVRITLETCDSIRTMLDGLAHDGAGRSISSDLLARLGVQNAVPATTGTVDARRAAFLNTTVQCVETIESCLARLENDNQAILPVAQTYLRAVRTLSAAARYLRCAELEEPLAQQLRLLETAVSRDAGLADEERASLRSGFEAIRAVLSQMSLEHGGVPAAPSLPTAETAANSLADRTGGTSSNSTVRIDQTKLDRLMTVVGELLVARGAIPLLVQRLNNGAEGAAVVKDLKDVGSSITRIADELQTSVMSIRMLPVKTVFQKFPRLVRDLARSLNKEVNLVLEGEGIELDKTILEQIGDPLVHVIRNSVDHGIELPEERRQRGKNTAGLLTIRAVHEAGSVSIEITDDGKGLNAEALKRKAVEKGLLTPEAAASMSDEIAYQLVFLPGLSTAAKVTDVSGRGVGMDVVSSNVRNLQGTVEIRSKLGRGTTLIIKLPTSLMISKGILLEAGGEQYVLPLSNIRDMVKLSPSAVHTYRGHTVAQVRGTIYSIFNLTKMLGLTSGASTDSTELSVAIVETGVSRYGLVVDKFITEVEVLVKPLNGGLERCKEFQGAAIMGDGRVVLVLNALECHSIGEMACN